MPVCTGPHRSQPPRCDRPTPQAQLALGLMHLGAFFCNVDMASSGVPAVDGHADQR